jgi:hypothetical protein
MRLRNVVPTLAAIVLLAEVSWCGELKPAACDPEAAGVGPAYCVSFDKPPKDCGTVNPKAVVGKVMTSNHYSGQASGLYVSVAIDSKDADSKAADAVRFDFTGQGKFDNATMVPLTATDELVGPKKNPVMQVGPGTIAVKRDGKQYLVSVKGKYMAFDPGDGRCVRQLVLQMAAAAEGQCDFGNKSHKVRMVDTTGNMSFTDPAALAVLDADWTVAYIKVIGDTVLIDTGDGSFTSTVKAFYGQPAMVDGKWYVVSASDDQTKVTANAVDVPSGTIKIDHPFWTATFVGTKYYQTVTGDANVLTLPADTYTIVNYVQRPDAKSKAGFTVPNYQQSSPAAIHAKTIAVAAGKNVDVTIGSPLQPTLAVNVATGAVNFNLKCTDASGSPVTSLTDEKGAMPAAPSFTIVDSNGKQVYQATLAYG